VDILEVGVLILPQANTRLHSCPRKNASARNDISFKRSQWKVLMTSRNLSCHLWDSGRSANDGNVLTSFPPSKSANRRRELRPPVCGIY